MSNLEIYDLNIATVNSAVVDIVWIWQVRMQPKFVII